jgi:hypothetical protein
LLSLGLDLDLIRYKERLILFELFAADFIIISRIRMTDIFFNIITITIIILVELVMNMATTSVLFSVAVISMHF